jgi:hypothetical protein
MKNTYLFILGSLFITQTVLAQRLRVGDQAGKTRYSHTKLGNGAGGANLGGFGGTGDVRPTEDGKQIYIKEFNDHVTFQRWAEAKRVQLFLKEKYEYLVYFTRTLSLKEQDRIKAYQAEYDVAFKAKDYPSAKKLYAEVWGLFEVHLVDPIIEVAATGNELTEKDWEIINAAQLSYNKLYAARNFTEAKLVYSKIFDLYKVALKTPTATAVQEVGVAVVDTKPTEKEIINAAQLTYNKYYAVGNFTDAKLLYNDIYKRYGVALISPNKAAQLEPVKTETLTEIRTINTTKTEAIYLDSVKSQEIVRQPAAILGR